MNRAAGMVCLNLQLHEQIHHRPGVRSSIQQIAETDQARPAPRPVVRRVDQAEGSQEGAKLIGTTVHIPKGDDSILFAARQR